MLLRATSVKGHDRAAPSGAARKLPLRGCSDLRATPRPDCTTTRTR